MAAMHVQRQAPKRNEKKKKNRASCAYNHVQPKPSLWPLMSIANNEITHIYYQVVKQSVKRRKLAKLKEASSLCFPQAAASFASKKSALLGLLFFLFFQAPGITSFPSAITHLPIPPSASMASSNHPHGQPYLWPVAHVSAHAWGGPPFFHKCNEKEPQIILPGPSLQKGFTNTF